ncbi:hypothetical protein N7488_006551 [Penicillium malachiteum]|nr:hypothetical protein N7488_006551 [Penicillium malachiteum]
MQFDIPSGTTKFNYTIGTELVVTARANDTVSVYRGALLYALYIKPDISSGPPKFYNNQSEYPAGTYPSQALDYVVLNTTEWNVAIDPTTLAYNPGSGPLLEPTFQDGALPMYMTAKVCLIDWPMFLGAVPGSPIPKKDRTCLGVLLTLRFVLMAVRSCICLRSRQLTCQEIETHFMGESGIW